MMTCLPGQVVKEQSYQKEYPVFIEHLLSARHSPSHPACLILTSQKFSELDVIIIIIPILEMRELHFSKF